MKRKLVSVLLGLLAISMLASCGNTSKNKSTKTTTTSTKSGKEDEDFDYSKAQSADLEVLSYDGDSRASLTLGLRFDYGIQGENQNYQEAKKWYESSATQGNSNAMVHLGYLYLFGLGTEQDLTKSMNYFNNAATAGNADGYAGLGRYYLNNPSIPDAASLAYSNIKTACDEDNTMGIYLMGYLYEKGIGVTQDTNTAITYYEKLIETTPSDVSKVKRYPYQEAYVRRSLIYLQSVLGDPTAGVTNTNPEVDTKDEDKENADKEQALKLLKTCAESNYAPAEYYLGIVYERGIGTSVSYSNAISYFEKASKKDYAPAQNRLGYIYFNGLGVDVDYNQSAYYQKLAAAQGYAAAQVNLGYLYEKGLGVDKNLNLARQYYQMAANQNFGGAEESVLRVDQLISEQAK